MTQRVLKEINWKHVRYLQKRSRCKHFGNLIVTGEIKQKLVSRNERNDHGYEICSETKLADMRN
jgi:hypothetical protein